MMLVVLMVMELVEVSKICQLLQIWPSSKNQNQLSPKSQIYQQPILQRSISEQILLLSKPKKFSYTYKRFLTRLQFLSILIQNVISELRLILWGILLLGS